MDDEDDDLYMSAPESKSIRGFIEALNIFSKYTKKGPEERFFCGAEHDILCIYVGSDTLDPKSQDGLRLRALGFHVDEESWSYFT